ncbi:MAG: T9SS type A sorting domain-containing protein [Gemmatimonadota bacterium]|nr:MAG: T9SS type A sorting domain-containing protein [Gemmatimonadota bacterium]
MNDKKVKRRYMSAGSLLAMMLLLAASSGFTQMASPNIQIRSSSLNSAGVWGSSANFEMRSSMGQPTPTGISQSANFACFAGFQPTTLEEFILPERERGDVNGDWTINIIDVLAVVNHILDTVPLTDPSALSRADCNGDREVNILDALGIVNVILGIGECAPGACRTELTDETLEFFKALQPHFPPEDFDTLMSLVKPEVQVPSEYSLAQNYPNPFNPVTTIEYTLPEAAKVRVEVYNVLGQVVDVLVDSEQEGGYHAVQWDASDMASGVYFYLLTAGDFTATKLMVLMK